MSQARPAGAMWVAVLGLGALACVGPQRPVVAGLRIVAEPTDARVYVNEKFAGTTRALSIAPLALRPGVHRVTVQAPGHFPHDLRLELPSGTSTLRIRLRPIPP